MNTSVIKQELEEINENTENLLVTISDPIDVNIQSGSVVISDVNISGSQTDSLNINTNGDGNLANISNNTSQINSKLPFLGQQTTASSVGTVLSADYASSALSRHFLSNDYTYTETHFPRSDTDSNTNLANNNASEAVSTFGVTTADVWLDKITFSVLLDDDDLRLGGWGDSNSALSNGFKIQYRSGSATSDFDITPRDIKTNHGLLELGKNHSWYYRNNNWSSMGSVLKFDPPLRIRVGINARLRLTRGIDDFSSGNVDNFHITYSYWTEDLTN